MRRGCLKNFLAGVMILAAVVTLFLTELRAAPVPALLSGMIRESRSVRTLTYTIRKWERIDGSLVYEENRIKYHRSPLRVYLRQTRPKQGLEVLYRQGENNGNLLINPAGPPYINLNLGMDNGQVRKNQHQSLRAVGFDQFAGVIEYILKTGGDDLRYETPVAETWNGREGKRVVLYNPNFRYRDYTLEPGETLFDVARKLRLSEYMIWKANPDLSWYDDCKPGQTIKVPSSYGKRVEIFLDGATRLPLVLRIYDEKGLFERYEYHDFVLNPEIAPGEFSADYEGYGF